MTTVGTVPAFDKQKTLMEIFRKELYYLGNVGWNLYCGTPDDKYMEHPDSPGVLMTVREAMNIEWKKEDASNGLGSA